MVKYNLEHLTQDDNQKVSGPIQDDEALFLFSLIRGNRMNRILEIGGLSGYSATNFLEALKYPGRPKEEPAPMMYTCDLNPVPTLAKNHKVILKNALYLNKYDLDMQPLDLVFFDCHDLCQIDIYQKLVQEGLITDETVLALHDTNLHYIPYQHAGYYLDKVNGYVHQSVERIMVNMFKSEGYDVVSLRTGRHKHSDAFPHRHGLSICQKFKYLET